MSVFAALDLRFVATGLLGGFAVGLTGMGGGAILTPLLLAMGVPPGSAVGSDLVVSLIMKPVAGSVHAKARNVRWDLVRWLSIGSVPAALLGSLASSRLTAHGDGPLRRAIGVTLIAAAISMVIRSLMKRRNPTPDPTERAPLRPVPTLVLGIAGGFLVGLTSVGSGSLMVVALTLLYPSLAATELVGTDIVQAIPLVAAAAAGHLLLGNANFGLTGALLIGGLPGAYAGARLSARPATRVVRPALVSVLLATGGRLLFA